MEKHCWLPLDTEERPLHPPHPPDSPTSLSTPSPFSFFFCFSLQLFSAAALFHKPPLSKRYKLIFTSRTNKQPSVTYCGRHQRQHLLTIKCRFEITPTQISAPQPPANFFFQSFRSLFLSFFLFFRHRNQTGEMAWKNKGSILSM